MSAKHESGEGLPPERRYLYLLLYSPGHTGKLNESIDGNTRLQNTMHVLSTIIPTLGIKFQENEFGIHSPALMAVQTQDIKSGLIDQADGKSIRLTDRGMDAARSLWDNLHEDERYAINGIKKLLNEMSYWEAVSFSYSVLPETTARSRFKSDMERHRLDSAVSLFKREKISTGKAAEIAGMPLVDFIEELGKRGIPAFVMDSEKFKASLKLIKEYLPMSARPKSAENQSKIA